MDLRHQLAAMRGIVPLIVVCAVVAGVIAYLISTALPRSYEARATLLVGQSLSAVNPDYGQLLASQRLSGTYAELATTRPLLEGVIEELDLPESPEELGRLVTASAALDSTLLTITAAYPDARQAAAIANGLAARLVEASPSLQGQEADIREFVARELSATQAQIEAVQGDIARLTDLPQRTNAEEAQLNALTGRLNTLRATYVSLLEVANSDVSNRVTLVEPAVEPQEAVWPRPLLNTALAAILAALTVLGIAVVATYFDDRAKNPERVRDMVDLPTLGGIPRTQAPRGRQLFYMLVMLLYPRSAAAEAYRTLRTNLDFASVDAPIRSLLVTSPSPGDGKTVTACNIALAFAQTGRRVLLVDADFRKPGIDSMFRLTNSSGLSTLLRGDTIGWESVVQSTEETTLTVLTTGPQPPNPAELIASRRMTTVLDRLVAAHDLVVVDSPPLLVVADGAILGKATDGVLVVFDVRRTRRDAARRSVEALTKAGARVLGVLLNGQPARDFAQYGSYYEAREGDPATKAVSPIKERSAT